jgi:hypothetical protein
MKYLFSALLIISLLVMTYVMAHIPEQPGAVDTRQLHDKHEAVRLFMEAVKRGELVVLGQTITRDMLKPVRVVYTYELHRSTPEISIYSEMIIPLEPGICGCELHAISVSIHPDGSILEVSSHVWPKEQ